MIEPEELLDMVTRPVAWRYMRRRYLQENPVCPWCGETITGARAVTAWHELRKVYCAGCTREFTATHGTPIHETQWKPEEFVQFLLLSSAGRSPRKISTTLGKSTDSVRHMIERVRLMHADSATAHPLPVEQATTSQG